MLIISRIKKLNVLICVQEFRSSKNRTTFFAKDCKWIELKHEMKNAFDQEWSKLPLTHAPVFGSQAPPEQWLQSYGSRPVKFINPKLKARFRLIDIFISLVDLISFYLPTWAQIGWWLSTWHCSCCEHWW